MITRTEHLAWCKERALEYVDAGDIDGGLASMLSDLGKHKETAWHPAMGLTAMLIMGGHLDTVTKVRKHIEGFN